MGILKVGTVEKASGEPVDLTKQDGAKAWVNFAGTGTITINRSLNITSLTDNGTGLYVANFTADMQYADFATSVVATTVWHCFSNSQSVSSFGVRSGSSGHVNYDATKIHGTVHGDLA